MPVRLNIDQVKEILKERTYQRYVWAPSLIFLSDGLVFVCLKDALFFLKEFFTSLATEVEFFSPPAQEGKINYKQLHSMQT